MNAHIRVFQMGGSIDKGYYSNPDNHGLNFSIQECAWHQIWQRALQPFDVPFTPVCQKDSLHLTDCDRQKLIDEVQPCSEAGALILHGSDTIKKTASALSHIDQKTIVLCGSHKPVFDRNTDADFIVGLGFGAAQYLPHGVYIALYGKVVPWNEYVPQ